MILPAPKRRPLWPRLPEHHRLRRPLPWLILLALFTVLVGVSAVAQIALELASPAVSRYNGDVAGRGRADYSLWPFGPLAALLPQINPEAIQAAERPTPPANPDQPPGPTDQVPVAVIIQPTAEPTPTLPLATPQPAPSQTAQPILTEVPSATPFPTPTRTSTPLPVRAPTQPPPQAVTPRAPVVTVTVPATTTPVRRPEDLQPTARPTETPPPPTATATSAPPTPTSTVQPQQPTSAPPTTVPPPAGTPTNTPSPTNTPEPTPPTLSFADESVAASEDQGEGSLEVRLSGSYFKPITVSYTTSGGSATAGADYTAASGTLTFSPGQLTKTIRIAIIKDGRNEANETVDVRLSGLTNATLTGSEVAVLTITDSDAPPTVRFVGSARTVAESGSSAAFTVELNQASDLAVAVPYTVAGTAVFGNAERRVGDHILRSGAVVIPAGATSARVRFSVVDDLVDEDDETVLITLSMPLNADLVSPTVYVVTIVDDDTAEVKINRRSFEIAEGQSATYSIVLNSEPTEDVTVRLRPDNQLSADPTTLTFTPESWATPQLVTFAARDDKVDEGNLHPGVLRHEVGSSDPRYNRIVVSDISVQIADNDTAGVQVGATAPLNLSESPAALDHTASYMVVLTSQPTAPVTVTTQPDGEVSTSPPALVFDASNWDAPQTVTVSAIDDDVDEDSDNNLTPHAGLVTHLVMSGDLYYAALPLPQRPADVQALIQDNDEAGILITPGTLALSESAAPVGTYTVQLTSRPQAPVTVSLAITDTGQISLAPATLVFNATNWNLEQTVTVTATNDLIDEGPDDAPQVRLVSHTATSGDGNYSGLAPVTKTVSVADDDTAGVIIAPATTPFTATEGLSNTYTVRLTSQPTADVPIALTSSAPPTVTLAPGNLLFTPTSWTQVQTVTVTALDNFLIDGTRQLTITHSSAASADPIYAALVTPTLGLTVLDNDAAALAFSAPISVTEGTSGAYSFALTSQPTDVVTVTVSGPPTLLADPTVLEFTPATWDLTQTVTVTPTGDTIFEGDRPLTLLHSFSSADANFAAAGPLSYTLTVVEDDVVELLPATPTISETTGFSLTIRLLRPPTDSVTFTLAPDAQLLVDPPTLVFTPADYALPQTVSVTAVDDALVETTPHTGTLSLSSASADLFYNRAWPAYTVMIEDNDPGPGP